MQRDERLDRVRWLISSGRHQDAQRELDRAREALAATSVGHKLTVEVPGLQQEINQGQNKTDAPDWGEIERKANEMVFQLMDDMSDRDQVANLAIDDLGAEYDVYEGTDRSRIVAKVMTAIERWERRHGTAEATG